MPQTSEDIKNVYSEEYWKAKKVDYENLIDRLKLPFEMADIKKGELILDLGGGLGEISYQCLKKGARVVYVDYSDYAIEQAKKIKGLEVHGCSILDFIKKEKRVFDKTFLVDVFEHLSREENEKLFRWLADHTKRVIIQTPIYKSYLKETGHIFVLPLEELKEFLNKHGFIIEKEVVKEKLTAICKRKKKVVAVSGYFIWLHAGHCEYFEKAKQLGDELVVILNNDIQQKIKYGKVIVPYKEREKIIESIRYVDRVMESIDKDESVCASLEALKPDIFAKGGDRTIYNIPEKKVCEENKIKIVWGLGKKIQSSSWLMNKTKNL